MRAPKRHDLGLSGIDHDFDVVSVQVNDGATVGRPFELDSIVLPYLDRFTSPAIRPFSMRRSKRRGSTAAVWAGQLPVLPIDIAVAMTAMLTHCAAASRKPMLPLSRLPCVTSIMFFTKHNIREAAMKRFCALAVTVFAGFAWPCAGHAEILAMLNYESKTADALKS